MMAKAIHDTVRRLRLLRTAKPPKCCGKPMRVILLNFGTLTEDDEQKLSEQEYADYLAKNVPIPPAWSCDVCHEERQIAGLDWPESTDPESSEPEPPEPVVRFCPHCGKQQPPS